MTRIPPELETTIDRPPSISPKVAAVAVIEQQTATSFDVQGDMTVDLDKPRVEFLDAGRRGQAMAIWQVLEDEMGAVPVMASFDWTDAWLNHYGDQLPHRFATLRIDSRYVGIALLTQGRHHGSAWPVERTWHLGTAGELDCDSACVEYNALLCPLEWRDVFFQQMFDLLRESSNWDGLLLDGFAWDDLPGVVRDDPRFIVETRTARWVNLDEIRSRNGEVMKSLGDSTRKNIRQTMRKLDMPRFEWAENRDHGHAIFDDLIRLHQARWTAVGKPGCYASRRFTGFHRELIDRLVPRRMTLARVSSTDEVLGCSLLLIDRGRVLVYQGGRALASHCSPGLITDYLCLEESLHRGYSAYDFMAGDSMHKKRLSNQETPLCWVAWRRPRWRYRIADTLRRGKQLLRSLMSYQPRDSQATQITSANPGSDS